MNRKTFVFVSLFLLLTLLTAGGAAMAQAPTVSWQAQYYNNPSLLGEPFQTVTETAIDHDWGDKAPLDGLPADNFSVRWTTDANFEAGTYTFSVTVDDGVRLWVDGNLLIDEWRRQAATTFTAQTHLSAGTHRIQVAYFEATGAAVIKVWWRQDRANGVSPTAAKLVIDNLDENFTWGGPLRYRFTAPGGQGNSFFWTKNTTTYPVNYGKWTPIFEAGGRYEVFAFIPATRATTRQMRYRILHNGQRHDVLVNQGWYSDEWVSLGTYTFRGDNAGREFILAYDNTRESYGSTAIAFDAVKLVPAPIADP